MYGQRGFTLIELLITMVIMGVLAAIAIPQAGAVKERTYVAAMKSDLRNLATAEEAYFGEHQAYAETPGALGQMFRSSQNVSVEISNVTASSWEGSAEHPGTDVTCSIEFTGTEAGLPICS